MNLNKFRISNYYNSLNRKNISLLMNKSIANMHFMSNKNTNIRGLNYIARRHFGQIQFIKKGFIMGTLKKIFSSRAGLYRFLFVCATIHAISTFSASMSPKTLMMSVSDFYQNLSIKENELFKLYGVFKVSSLKLRKGATDSKFIVTDFKNEVEVQYNGVNKFEFKEGETIILTAYIPDIKHKNRIVCIDYMSKHSMEVENWQGAENQQRSKFGLTMDKKGALLDNGYMKVE